MKPDRRSPIAEVQLVARHQSGDERPPYERLLGDASRGDATLFARKDDVEAAWRVVDPILGAPMPLHVYEPGTWGPHAANDLLGPESSGRYAPGTVAPALK